MLVHIFMHDMLPYALMFDMFRIGNGGIGIFRNAPNFVSQFGIHGVPEIAQKWDGDTIEDDPMVAVSQSCGCFDHH